LDEEKSQETSLPEHVLWRAARVGKDGVVKEDVQQIYQKCVSISLFLELIQIIHAS
jgi:hypothetical protein